MPSIKNFPNPSGVPEAENFPITSEKGRMLSQTLFKCAHFNTMLTLLVMSVLALGIGLLVKFHGLQKAITAIGSSSSMSPFSLKMIAISSFILSGISLSFAFGLWVRGRVAMITAKKIEFNSTALDNDNFLGYPSSKS